jgi:hypothetical protein
MSKLNIRYPHGTRVVNRETGVEGTVIYVFEDPKLSDLRVVRFDAGDIPVSVPLSSIRAVPKRRRRAA